MKREIKHIKLFNKYKVMSSKEQIRVTGGGHCYTKSCLVSRDKSMYSAGSFLAGLGYGVCQSVGACD